MKNQLAITLVSYGGVLFYGLFSFFVEWPISAYYLLRNPRVSMVNCTRSVVHVFYGISWGIYMCFIKESMTV